MTSIEAALTTTIETTVDRLIENGTFGTVGARSLSRRTPDEVARTVVERTTTARGAAVPDSSAAETTGTPGNAWMDNNLGEMIEGASNGDRNALLKLVQQIRPLVVRYCRTRVGQQELNYDVADAVAQEVCVAVLAALPGFRDQGRPFLAFVYGIAAHKVAGARRAIARNRVKPVAQGQSGSEQTAVAELSTLLQTLPARQREIVVLRIVVGLSVEETAAAIGSTPGAVRVAQHRALRRLRDSLPVDQD